jgi:hypothetical protein
MKKIKVDDWILYETYHGHSCLGFETGQVLCVLPEHAQVIVRMGGLVLSVRNEHIFVVGDRDKIGPVKRELDTMLKDRLDAIKKIDDRRSEVAGEHAQEIRRMLKKAGQ